MYANRLDSHRMQQNILLWYAMEREHPQNAGGIVSMQYPRGDRCAVLINDLPVPTAEANQALAAFATVLNAHD